MKKTLVEVVIMEVVTVSVVLHSVQPSLEEQTET